MLHGRGGKRRRRIDPRARAFLRDLWTEADTGENCRDGTLSAGRRGVWMDWRSRADGADGGGCAGVVCRDGGSGSGRCAECAGARSRDCGGRAARAARGNPGGSGAGDSHAGNVGGSRTCRETAGGTGVSCGAFPFGGTGSSAGAVVVFLWAGDRKIVDGRDKGQEELLSPMLREYLGVTAKEPPVTLESFMESCAERDLVREDILRQMGGLRVLLSPVSSGPAFRHGAGNYQPGDPHNYRD